MHKNLDYQNEVGNQARPCFAVAPMLDWTDRHCRFLFRQLSHYALLYTEMVVADAIIHGPRQQLLDFSAIEHPVALQLGGSDAKKLLEAAKIACDFGYDEINLNVGCPSDRVQSGAFGACLMKTPVQVGEYVAMLKAHLSVPVTVKCRIGVDQQPVPDALYGLAEYVLNAGVDALWIHARQAWLEGLSPKENRHIPPLQYETVYAFKEKYPEVFVGINGGITDFTAIDQHLQHVDAVMLGRAVYTQPELLCQVDTRCYGQPVKSLDSALLIENMVEYAQNHIQQGGKLHQVTRHMIGLFHGYTGAKNWRKILSSAGQHESDASLIRKAFLAIDFTKKLD